ncbi:hypothetical protein ABGV42_00380 [Paenibacillus pabuli]|uniref:hypothetical protein n=1 Tax=Paenibacillus pabuli TaxID=1472 RepID=UPI003242C467
MNLTEIKSLPAGIDIDFYVHNAVYNEHTEFEDFLLHHESGIFNYSTNTEYINIALRDIHEIDPSSEDRIKKTAAQYFSELDTEHHNIGIADKQSLHLARIILIAQYINNNENNEGE